MRERSSHQRRRRPIPPPKRVLGHPAAPSVSLKPDTQPPRKNKAHTDSVGCRIVTSEFFHPLWKLVRDGSAVEATQACLAATIKTSRLVGDFLDLVVREQYRTFKENLSLTLFADYLQDCRGRDPEMPQWSESTITRLRSSVYTILAEAGYIDSTKTRKLQAVHVVKPVIRYLEQHDEQYVLRCIQVGT